MSRNGKRIFFFFISVNQKETLSDSDKARGAAEFLDEPAGPKK